MATEALLLSPTDQVLQELSQLLKLCDDRLREQPMNTDALFTKALFLVRAGDSLRAIHYLHMITDIDPGYPGVWHAKAMVYRAMGKPAMADLCVRVGSDFEAAM